MKAVVFFSLFAAAATVAACGTTSNTADPGPVNTGLRTVKPDPNATLPTETLAVGKKLYASNCAACHREDGKGGKIEFAGKVIKPDDLTSDKIRGLPDEKLYGDIFNGFEDEGMPAFRDKLSEAEIREVVRYVRVGIQKLPDLKTKDLIR